MKHLIYELFIWAICLLMLFCTVSFMILAFKCAQLFAAICEKIASR